MKVINNRALLNLIGKKFHVRDIREFTEFEQETRDIMKLTRLNGVRWIDSIIFHVETEPEIAFSESPRDHENVEFCSASDVVFSPASGSAAALSPQLFNSDGSLISSLGVSSRIAA